ncbi:MAG: oligosaccharide flippase family protein [Lachnospiraceae bacterium]|nr:oligosaccharide flippase family protein [Lachnospiraceae bacterium]
MKKHPILSGTLILSGASFLSRIIGFLYRIYQTRTFGASAVGVLQMTAPVTAMVMAVSCYGMQTALSKRIAELPAHQKQPKRAYLLAALFFSISLSVMLTILVHHYSGVLANEYLQEPQTEALLRILSLSFVPAAIHSCFSGYWIGQQKARYPALCQLIEQITRVGTVIVLCESAKMRGIAVSLPFAVIGSVAGELASVCVCLLCAHLPGVITSRIPIIKANDHIRFSMRPLTARLSNITFCTGQLFSMAAPLSLNRLAMNFLQSVEAVRIPLSLRLYGYSAAEALTVYGILSGIVLPVLYFPGAVIGPLSQMLLPAISQAQARKDYAKIKTITLNASFILVFLGVFCSLTLLLFSDFLGNSIFLEPLAAGYIRSLCLICPVLYLNQVLSGILQGLGDAFAVLFINTLSVFARLCFIFFSIPQIGIRGYFYGLLISQLSAAIFFLYKCLKHCQNA